MFTGGSSVPVWLAGKKKNISSYFWQDLLLTLSLWAFRLLSSLLLSPLTASTPHYDVTHQGRGRCHRCSSQSSGRVQDSPWKEVCRVWVTGRSNPQPASAFFFICRHCCLPRCSACWEPWVHLFWHNETSVFLPVAQGTFPEMAKTFLFLLIFFLFFFFVCFVCLGHCEANKQK